MIVLKPIRHDTIWGGNRIEKMTGVSGDSIGHLYSVFCREEMSNEILNGEYRGKTLNEVFPLFKENAHMREYEYFPLTLALTEADLDLSVQVHPDDETAGRIEHKARGKRESWYFIDPPHNGYIINGCICKNKTEVRKLLDEKKYPDILDRLQVKTGDYVFVEPGTLHSITAGSLVYEIEEGADNTYRFYDYDRTDKNGNKRELHIEKAYLTLDVNKKSAVKRYSNGEEILEKTYGTRKLENISFYKNRSDNLECFTLVQGEALCDGAKVTPGMTVLLWPEEEINDLDGKLVFIARMREDI